MIYLSNAWRQARRLRRRARVAVAAVAIAGTAAAVFTVAPLASAHPGLPSAVFDPDEAGWASVRDRTPAQFQTDFDKWTGAKHIVIDLEADTFSGDLRLGAVFQQNLDNRGSYVKTRMTAAEYEEYFEFIKRHDMRLVDREVYVLDGARYYAAAAVENVEGYAWHTKHDLTYAQFVAYYEEQKAAGRLPVDFDVYSTAGGIRYGLIWVFNAQNLAWRLHGDLSEAEYAKRFDEYAVKRLRLLVMDSVQGPSRNDGQRFGGVFVENRNGRAWRARRDMTAQQYANWWHRYADQGFRQIFVGRYMTADGPRYASGWRQTNDRPVWTLKDAVDTRVEAEMAVDDLPGVSVAVMQNGQFRYVRGFGHADVANDVWMDSDHVLRTASLSKSVAGVLGLRLHEQGVLDRDDVPAGLPAHHTATYEQLLSNRGCVRHYAKKSADPDAWEADQELASTWYATAGAAAPLYWNDPLVAGCTVGANEVYSSFGGNLAATGAEALSGVSAADLIRQRISDPLGLPTLRQEQLADGSVRRAKAYQGAANAEVGLDQTTWKPWSGGVESTAKDVARFGSALLAGQIISAANVEHIWSGTGWSYAYGFDIGSESGHRKATKSGGARGSDAFLQMYPDDGIVIVVLINREELAEADNNAKAIAGFIGTKMLAQLP
jgi:CubicO group peptidase (beta-lactamase class C family)